jgi:D-glucosaminate-6-phosphate ammonia-lyase
MKRRDVIKGLTLLPIAGGIASSMESVFAAPAGKKIDWFSKAASPGPLKIGSQVYQSIGVEPIINCRGTFTIIGASIVEPQVREAMEHAHKYNVQLDELAFGVGQRLAELSGAEWGVVSCGCAGGIKIVTAACVSGGNPEKLMYIPLKTMSMEKNEVIIPTSSRTVYDHAVRNIGVKIVQVDNLEQLTKAINPRTAMIYMKGDGANASGAVASGITVANVAKVANAQKVPVFVDAAAENLTLKPNTYLAAGATVVAYSGGKTIRGPQSAGLLLGNKALLMSAWQASAPHHGPARDNKVGREEQIGMLAAVEAWATRDQQAEEKVYASWIDNIVKRVSRVDGVQTTVRAPYNLTISWDPLKLNITGTEVADELATTAPRVAVGGGSGGNARGTAISSGSSQGEGGRAADAAGIPNNMTFISLNVSQMGPDNDKIVGDRIHEILSRKRSAPKPVVAMRSPAADISGRWDVTVEFYNSTSQHKFFIEQQEGNWLEGSHTGEYSTREMVGTIDDNQVKFYSYYKSPDDPNSFGMTFYGTLTGDSIAGEIDMGEYITAKFTAKKYKYAQRKQAVNVPLTRPLSS